MDLSPKMDDTEMVGYFMVRFFLPAALLPAGAAASALGLIGCNPSGDPAAEELDPARRLIYSWSILSSHAVLACFSLFFFFPVKQL